MQEYEDLMKEKEEHEEHLEAIKYKNNELNQQRLQTEAEIIEKTDKITEVNNTISDTKKKALEKEAQKKELEQETVRLREDIGK